MTLGIDLRRDLLYAFRRLRKTRRFTLLAAGTLALGIGASTAEFATMDALLLRPMPRIRESRSLAAIREFNERERIFTALTSLSAGAGAMSRNGRLREL
jgi:NO-binding membrane sensor protein with MHYT domain